MMSSARVVAASAAVALMPFSAWAATATSQFNVRVVIQAECKVQVATDLDFGSHGVLDGSVDTTSTIGIQCTNGTPYTVGIGAGSGVGATITARKMTGPASAYVVYSIYKDGAHALAWGDMGPAETVAGMGNGATQSLTAYGRIPPQATPAPGTYTDVVTVTVSY